MGHSKMKVKSGMGGSRNGRSRNDGTETMKKVSKKRRRKQGRQEAREELHDIN